MRDEYVRAAEVVEVIDGDSVRLAVDLGFYVQAVLICRLAGLNCAELNQPGGREARAAVSDMLAEGEVTVRSVRVDKYGGRFTAELWVNVDGEPIHVNRMLVDLGLAVPWDGRGPRPPVPWPPPLRG